MTTIGFDKPLYILPFDHRGSFQTKMFGWKGTLTAEQTAEIAAAKQVIYDGFKAAIQDGVPEKKAGILVDEQFGAAILRDAAAHRYITACSVEKSGQDEFDFEYGEDFARHIEAFRPTFCKVLVRYNPEGDRELNRRQAARLKRLSDYLHGQSGQPVHVRVAGARREVAARAVQRRQEGLRRSATSAADGRRRSRNCRTPDVEPDVWKIEGLDRREDCEKVVAAARRGGRDGVGCIILGRGEDDRKVQRMARDGGRSAGFHRLRRRPHQFLGSAWSLGAPSKSLASRR